MRLWWGLFAQPLLRIDEQPGDRDSYATLVDRSRPAQSWLRARGDQSRVTAGLQGQPWLGTEPRKAV
jgi:hypothetical protein